MYVKKSILLLILFLNVSLGAYIVIDNRAVFADSLADPLDGTRLDATFEMVPLSGAPAADAQGSGWEDFEATAYSNFGITRSGVWVHRGILAVDPSVIPIGSIVEVQAGGYSGIYTAMDTGDLIKGRLVDVYVPTTPEALRFGRQAIRLRLIRRGWNPANPTDLLPGLAPPEPADSNP
jgi:3D (Asp-Asp-Asp) domain-containing protein